MLHPYGNNTETIHRLYDITLSLVMQSSFNKFFFLDKIHLLGLVVGIRGKHLVSQ